MAAPASSGKSAGGDDDGARRIRAADLLIANQALCRILVGRSKTQAGLREVPMLPIERDILAAHKASSPRTGPDDLVCPTANGTVRDKDNLRAKVLAPVLRRADELLIGRGQVPLPKGVSPHKLRHTFASILIATGVDVASVRHQLGHTDAKFMLSVSRCRSRTERCEAARRDGPVPPPAANRRSAISAGAQAGR